MHFRIRAECATIASYIQYFKEEEEDGMFAIVGKPVALDEQKLKQLKETGNIPNPPKGATHFQLKKRLEVRAPNSEDLLKSSWFQVTGISPLS